MQPSALLRSNVWKVFSGLDILLATAPIAVFMVNAEGSIVSAL